MVIGIDNISPGGSTSVTTIGGMRSYLEDLLTFLPSQISSYEFKLFSPEGSLFIRASEMRNLDLVLCKNVPTNRLGRVIYEQFVLPRLVHTEKVDVWLGTCNTIPLIMPCKTVLIIQSMQYLTYPKAFAAQQRLYLCIFGRLSAKRADRLVALSSSAKEMIKNRFKISAQKIGIAYNGLSKAILNQLTELCTNDFNYFSPKIKTLSPYLLCVSSFYEYKNLPRLIEAFARASTEFRHKLVLVGAETKHVSKKSLQILAAKYGIEDRVVFIGRVLHEHIASFYYHADALAMPSLEETFGLPILEAMALGCPVITSATGSMAEIAGDAACLVNPLSIYSIADGITRTLKDRKYHDMLITKGVNQVQQFVNNRSVNKIACIIKELANAHSTC